MSRTNGKFEVRSKAIIAGMASENIEVRFDLDQPILCVRDDPQAPVAELPISPEVHALLALLALSGSVTLLREDRSPLCLIEGLPVATMRLTCALTTGGVPAKQARRTPKRTEQPQIVQ